MYVCFRLFFGGMLCRSVESDHFQCCQSRFCALVPGRAAYAVDGLLLGVDGEHTEYHRCFALQVYVGDAL